MPSFDVVCRVDLQEVDNAIDQTLREVGQRFDFRGTPTEVRREERAIHLRSADEFKLRALGDILRERLAKRQVPLKAIQAGPIEPAAGGSAKQRLELQHGIPIDSARELVKRVKDTKRKVQVAIQGDQLRVSGKQKDDLQAAMQTIREAAVDVAVQFVNYRD